MFLRADRPALAFLIVAAATEAAIAFSAWAQDSRPQSRDSTPVDSSPEVQKAQADLRYAGQSSPSNVLVIDVNNETAYDDNIFSNNRNRAGGLEFLGGAQFGLRQNRRRLSLELDYRPDVIIFQNAPGYNQLNHALRIGANYQASPRVTLRSTDSMYYRTGLFEPRANENFSSEVGAPPVLNQTHFVPLVRELTFQGRLDAFYQKSLRTSIDVFGNLEDRSFSAGSSTARLLLNPRLGNFEGGGTASLFNTRGASAGAQYAYRASRAAQVGAIYLFQGLQFGEVSSAQIQSALLSASFEADSGTTLSLFGGPQYARTIDDALGRSFFGQRAPTFRISRSHWNGGAGGILSKRTERTVLQISAQRLITDGGGLLASVVNTSQTVEVRRRLLRSWDALVRAGNSRSASLSLLFGEGAVQSQSAGLSIEHRFSENFAGQVGYHFIRQRTSGSVPFLADMDRNRISLGFFYHIGNISLQK